MATVDFFPGTYHSIDDPENIKWTANLQLSTPFSANWK